MPEESDQTRETDQGAVRSWRRRVGRALLLYVLTPYLAVTLLFTVLQRRLLYPATKTGQLKAADVAGATDVELGTADGLTLHGWHFHADDATAEDQRLLVLYFPGNSGCRRDRVADCRDFTRLGCDVLLFDYRGYGDNKGSPGEDRLAADARREWLLAVNELNVAADRIVIFGESLGGAVAVRLAAELSEEGTPPAGLVLNSTFATLPGTVGWHYPAFPFPFQFLLLDRYPSARRMPDVACPVLQFHGPDDEFVPVEHGRELFDAAPEHSTSGVEKRFIVIERGTHNNIPVRLLADELSELLSSVRRPLDSTAGTR